ncbi:hypothetical protein POL68_11270 [Stigmatella sp. ncwal1]|uniref:Lipoprotein n=1 Tax=Stigmatella ashevillensis TaxID=2995309 RepID=A0ABT5D5U8_9BACT|nr:hypothetical protein [Stigmatella ashevillena]MDC0709043.1 hypothetical protein [Stigmatella ashevillena]
MIRKSLLCVSLLFVGCGQNQEQEFREGLPTSAMVAVKAPGRSGQKLETAPSGGMALGQTSDFYALTLKATETINRSPKTVLDFINGIAQNVPTSIQGDTAVWGSYSDPMSPNAWQLAITQMSENTYRFKLEGKDKNAADSAFKVILSGTHTLSTDSKGNRRRNFGSGSFTLDWDAAQTLPAHDYQVGTLQLTYSRVSEQEKATVSAAFRQVHDDAQPGALLDAVYHYQETPGAGGALDFALDKNMDDASANRPGIEHLTIRSRWIQTGAGRSDVTFSEGDLGNGNATASECWDSSFASQYFTISVGAPGYGEVAACAPFTTPDYSSL